MPPTRFQFADFELDLARYELRHAGRPVKLEKIPMELLVLLLRRKGELVSREEIIGKLWGKDVFVDTEQGINTAIRKIRQALHDDPEKPQFVQTVVGRGYRFIPAVHEEAPGPEQGPPSEEVSGAAIPSPPPRSRRRLAWLVVALVLMAALVVLGVGTVRGRLFSRAVPPIRSLAVLPLENLTGDPEQEYFADGMTEALTTELAQISALRVISRKSVMQYKNSPKPLPVIAKELKVDAVVEGSVQRSGNRVRVSTQLIEASTDRHLWAKTFERDFSDILSLHRDFARAIADEVRVQLTPREQQQLARARPVKPEAHEAYLKGLYYWNRRMVDKAIGYFQQATDLDPGYALAYAGLARCHALGGAGGLPPKESFQRAREAATKALEIDDALAEARVALAYVRLFYDWDWSGAEAEFKHALELNPNYATAHQWYANVLALTGRYEEAFEEDRRAQALDPLSPVLYGHAGNVYSYVRQYDRASEQYRKALDLDPSYIPAREGLLEVYERKGMFEETLSERERIAVLSGGKAEEVTPLREAYARSGSKGYWQKQLELNLAERQANLWPAWRARLYARVGQDEKAIQWLNKAYEQRDYELLFLKNDPAFNHLRSDPRFQDLLRRVGLPN